MKNKKIISILIAMLVLILIGIVGVKLYNKKDMLIDSNTISKFGFENLYNDFSDGLIDTDTYISQLTYIITKDTEHLNSSYIGELDSFDITVDEYASIIDEYKDKLSTDTIKQVLDLLVLDQYKKSDTTTDPTLSYSSNTKVIPLANYNTKSLANNGETLYYDSVAISDDTDHSYIFWYNSSEVSASRAEYIVNFFHTAVQDEVEYFGKKVNIDSAYNLIDDTSEYNSILSNYLISENLANNSNVSEITNSILENSFPIFCQDIEGKVVGLYTQKVIGIISDLLSILAKTSSSTQAYTPYKYPYFLLDKESIVAGDITKVVNGTNQEKKDYYESAIASEYELQYIIYHEMYHLYQFNANNDSVSLKKLAPEATANFAADIMITRKYSSIAEKIIDELNDFFEKQNDSFTYSKEVGKDYLSKYIISNNHSEAMAWYIENGLDKTINDFTGYQASLLMYYYAKDSKELTNLLSNNSDNNNILKVMEKTDSTAYNNAMYTVAEKLLTNDFEYNIFKSIDKNLNQVLPENSGNFCTDSCTYGKSISTVSAHYFYVDKETQEKLIGKQIVFNGNNNLKYMIFSYDENDNSYTKISDINTLGTYNVDKTYDKLIFIVVNPSSSKTYEYTYGVGSETVKSLPENSSYNVIQVYKGQKIDVTPDDKNYSYTSSNSDVLANTKKFTLLSLFNIKSSKNRFEAKNTGTATITITKSKTEKEYLYYEVVEKNNYISLDSMPEKVIVGATGKVSLGKTSLFSSSTYDSIYSSDPSVLKIEKANNKKTQFKYTALKSGLVVITAVKGNNIVNKKVHVYENLDISEIIPTSLKANDIVAVCIDNTKFGLYSSSPTKADIVKAIYDKQTGKITSSNSSKDIYDENILTTSCDVKDIYLIRAKSVGIPKIQLSSGGYEIKSKNLIVTSSGNPEISYSKSTFTTVSSIQVSYEETSNISFFVSGITSSDIDNYYVICQGSNATIANEKVNLMINDNDDIIAICPITIRSHASTNINAILYNNYNELIDETSSPTLLVSNTDSTFNYIDNNEEIRYKSTNSFININNSGEDYIREFYTYNDAKYNDNITKENYSEYANYEYLHNYFPNYINYNNTSMVFTRAGDYIQFFYDIDNTLLFKQIDTITDSDSTIYNKLSTSYYVKNEDDRFIYEAIPLYGISSINSNTNNIESTSEYKYINELVNIIKEKNSISVYSKIIFTTTDEMRNKNLVINGSLPTVYYDENNNNIYINTTEAFDNMSISYAVMKSFISTYKKASLSSASVYDESAIKKMFDGSCLIKTADDKTNNLDIEKLAYAYAYVYAKEHNYTIDSSIVNESACNYNEIKTNLDNVLNNIKSSIK